MNNMTHQEMIEFVERCLYSYDRSYESDFKRLDYNSQIFFIQEMINIFRTWNWFDFLDFKKRNTFDGIFDNLTFDVMSFFMINLSIDFHHQVSKFPEMFVMLYIPKKNQNFLNHHREILEKNFKDIWFGRTYKNV